MDEKPSFSFFNKLFLSLKIIPSKEKGVLFGLFFISLLSFIGVVYKLNNYYSIEVPDYGGSFKEGVIGSPRFINPLLAVTDTDRDLVKLIYSGLLELDNGGSFVPILAERYNISKDGLIYTFYLNKKNKWSDGTPLLSDDIIFTVKKAKDPALNSFQRANWEGVNVEKVDDYTVRFYLKKPYAPFLENTALPIIPKHIWESVSSEEMSVSNFNLEPVGSGPYKVKKIYKNSSGNITSYRLSANKNFSLGKPYIKYLDILFYPSEEKIIDAFKQNKIDATGFISAQNIENVITKNNSVKNLGLPRVFGLFFNSSNNVIFEDKAVRWALNLAIDKRDIINKALKGYAAEIDSPIPPGSIAGNEIQSAHDSIDFDKRIANAKQELEKNGWQLKDGVYQKKMNKKNVNLEFSVSTSNSPGLIKTAEILKEEWEKMGAKVNLKIFEIGDLNQTVIRKRNYEVLLFGEILGHDPDPFAFWHSSQRADPGLNIAMYANNSVDKILEEARAETDLGKRAEDYTLFKKKIKEDEAAIFLFSPYFIYIMPSYINGADIKNISSPQERFSGVYKWFIYKNNVWKVFIN